MEEFNKTNKMASPSSTSLSHSCKSTLRVQMSSPKCLYKIPTSRRNLFYKPDDDLNSFPTIADVQKVFFGSTSTKTAIHATQMESRSNSNYNCATNNNNKILFRHPNIFLTLAEALQSSYHTDVTFLLKSNDCDESENEDEVDFGDSNKNDLDENNRNTREIIPIQAHKLILSFGSPVFDAMFFGSMPEKGDEIEIMDIYPQAFKIMLQFLYTGFLLINDPSLSSNSTTESDASRSCTVRIALNVLYAARKYDLIHLEKSICSHLEERVNLESAVPILEAALLYECLSLQQKCWDYIEYYTDDFVRSPYFQGIPKEILKRVLSRDFLSIKEINLFRGLQQWIKANVIFQQDEDQEQNQEHNVLDVENTEIFNHRRSESQHFSRACIQDLIYLIRYPCMTPSEFADGPAQSGLLTQEEICNVFVYICSTKDTEAEEDKHKCIFNCEYRRWRNPHIYSKCTCVHMDGLGFGSVCNFCQPLQSSLTREIGKVRGAKSSLLAPATPPRYCPCRTRDFCPETDKMSNLNAKTG